VNSLVKDREFQIINGYRMRILVASASYPTPDHPKFLGGAETFSVQLCETLAARGNVVRVVRSGPVWGTWDRETVNGVEVVTLPTHNLYSPWQNRSKSRYVRAAWHLIEDWHLRSAGFDSVLREFMPDVLHTNSLYGLTAALWSKAAARKVPVVHTLHDYYLTCARSTRFKNGSQCQMTCLDCSFLTNGRRKATDFIDAVVSVSARTLAIHRNCGLFENTAKQAIIRNPPPKATADVSAVLADDDKITFGFIGRPSEEKGIFDLLSALQAMPSYAARLLIAGAAEPDTRSRIAEFGGNIEIVFLGFIAPFEFFPKIDVMVIPSIWEDPCPMVIGESFTYARPVVGARRGGIPELIDDASGWLYEPGTGELESLLMTLASERAAVATKSQHLLDNLASRDFGQLVSEYVSVYEDAIAARRISSAATRA
jgi:glycosyltransferase involved in cell wall biosynthesis